MIRLALLVLLVYAAVGEQPQCILEDHYAAICVSQGYVTIPTNFQYSINILKLRNNQIVVLSVAVLRLYPQITELDLKQNQLASHQDIKAIKVLKKLKILDLSGNLLQIMDFSIFRENIYLEELNLDDNPYMFIVEKAVILKNLKRLSLRNNKMNYFPSDAIRGFLNLEVLDLRNNPIKIEPGDMSKFPKTLIYLYFDDNPTGELDKMGSTSVNLVTENVFLQTNKINAGYHTEVEKLVTTQSSSKKKNEETLYKWLWYNILAAMLVAATCTALALHFWKEKKQKQSYEQLQKRNDGIDV